MERKKLGRKPDASSRSGQIRELLSTGMPAAEIAKKVGCALSLVYNVKYAMAGKVYPRKPRPGRPRKTATPTTDATLAGLDGILVVVKGAEMQRARLRAALERIATIVNSALS